MTLRAADADAVLTMASELARIDDGDQLIEAVLARLPNLIPGEVTGFNVFDLPAHAADVLLRPAAPVHVALGRQLSDTIDDHPMVRHLTAGDLRPCRISDLVSPQEWRSTAAYSCVLGPMGTPHLLGLPIGFGPAGGCGYAVTRSGSDFTARDCEVAGLLQPALVALHARWPAWGASSGSAPLVDTAAQVAPAGRRPVLPRGAALTARELEVLRLVAAGHTAQAIALRLAISSRTVRKHLEHAYAKIGVHDRLVAVDRCRTLGLLP